MNKNSEAWQHGYNDGKYGFAYLNPCYTEDELKEWQKGFKKGLKEKKSQKETENEAENE